MERNNLAAIQVWHTAVGRSAETELPHFLLVEFPPVLNDSKTFQKGDLP